MKSLIVITAIGFFCLVNPVVGEADVCAGLDKKEYKICEDYQEDDCANYLAVDLSELCKDLEEKYFELTGEVIPGRACPGWTTDLLNKIYSGGCDGETSVCEQYREEYDGYINYRAKEKQYIIEDGEKLLKGYEYAAIVSFDSDNVGLIYQIHSMTGEIKFSNVIVINPVQTEACKQELIDHPMP